MADTGAFQDITNELKNAYPPGAFEEPVNKETFYRKSLTRVELTESEGIATFPLGIASAWNVSMIPDVGELPTPIDPTRVQGQVTPELFSGSFQIGVITKSSAKSTRGTFSGGGIYSDRVETTTEDLGKYINKVYCGSSYGRLGVVLTNDGSNQVTLDDPLRALLPEKNMRVQFYDALTGGSVRATSDGAKLTLVNKDTGQLTYDGSADGAIAAGDSLFINGSYGRSIWTLPMIVGDIADAASIFGKSRTTYPELSALIYRSTTGLRDLTEQLMLFAIDGPRRETGKRITRAMSNSGQARKYVEFIQGERRYPGPQGRAPQYTLGYDDESLQIIAPGVNCRLEVDFDLTPRRIYFLAWDTFGLYESMPLDWLDDDTLLKMIPTSGGHKAGFLSYLGCVENQINVMPRANSRLEDLNDPILGD